MSNKKQLETLCDKLQSLAGEVDTIYCNLNKSNYIDYKDALSELSTAIYNINKAHYSIDTVMNSTRDYTS